MRSDVVRAYREPYAMRQLKDVEVDGMALVRRPANKKRFLTKKSEEAAVPSDSASQVEAPPAAVQEAIDAIKLSKGESTEAHEALHTAAHVLAGRSDLTLQDLMAYGQAMGLEDVAKASEKKADKKDPEAEAEGMSEDDKKKKNPFAKTEAPAAEEKAPTTKSASASAGEGEAMPTEQARNFVSKSEHDQLIERLTKSELELADIRSRETLRLEKSANQQAYAALELDHDALAGVTTSLRKSDTKQLEALQAILKSANEQVRVSRASGGSAFRPQSIRGGLAKSEQQGINQFNTLVAKHREANPTDSQAAAIQAVAKSAEGLAAYRASKGEI